MEKTEFLLRQLRKTAAKSYENYAVSRIIHAVNDDGVKFITQQFIRGRMKTRRGKRAFTDLYLPQLALHVEVDEPHHTHQVDEDRAREEDIVDITNHEVLRIDARAPLALNVLNQRIDEVVDLIRKRIARARALGTFREWDPAAELNPETYVRRGYVRVQDDVAFRRIAEACCCFGHSYKHYQRALARHPYELGVTIWFPKLYEHDLWENSISEDETRIYERRKQDHDAFLERSLESSWEHKRIVFAHVRGSLGDTLYRFKGVYVLDQKESRRQRVVVYRRTATEAKTYSPRVQESGS